MTLESVAHGFRSGLRFLSLMMLVIGLVVASLAGPGGEGLAGAARGRATPDATGRRNASTITRPTSLYHGGQLPLPRRSPSCWAKQLVELPEDAGLSVDHVHLTSPRLSSPCNAWKLVSAQGFSWWSREIVEIMLGASKEKTPDGTSQNSGQGATR